MGPALTIGIDVQGRRAVLTIDNPGRGNALSPEMMLDLARGLDRAAEAGVRAAVIRGGGGRAFCSGYDMAAMPHGAAEGAPDSWDDRFPELAAMLRALERFPAPLIAQMGGHAIGGGALVVAACDFRLAQAGATFQIPASRLGVLYPLPGLRRLVALVGMARAGRLLLLGDAIRAEEGLAFGLFDEVVAAENLQSRVDALAAEIEARAPLTVAGLRALLHAEAQGVADEEVRALHRHWTTRCLGSADLPEGLAAARERRAPRFEGR